MITVSCLPPIIFQSFNKGLLYTFLQNKKYLLENEIIPLSIKKIRDIDTGKRREFDKLLKEWQEIYERKEIEEVEYAAKVKEIIEKRPGSPIASDTARFKRMDPKNRPHA